MFASAEGPFLLLEAVHAAEYLRFPVALDLIDKLAHISYLKTASGKQAAASVQWQADYQAPLLAMLRVLQRHGMLDPQFHPVFETHSKSGAIYAPVGARRPNHANMSNIRHCHVPALHFHP